MTGGGIWSRRSVLEWLGCSGMLAALLALRGPWLPAPNRARAAIPGASDLFDHAQSARIVGQVYLRAVPHERDEERLANLILAEWAGDPTRPIGTREFKDYIAARRKIEYELGRTVRVDGWVLARTEARLCALAALTA